jgi:hypothetical protein
MPQEMKNSLTFSISAMPAASCLGYYTIASKPIGQG